jgi:ribonuclease HII
MQETLNLSAEEKAPVRAVLSGYERLPEKPPYAEMRVRHKGCTVTLYSSGKLLIQGDRHSEVASGILSALKMPEQLLVGIDETGRGEKSGPFVVSAVFADKGAMLRFRDSKKTAKIADAAALASGKALSTAVFSVSPAFIDRLREKGVNMNRMQASAVDAAALFFRSMWPEAKIIVDGGPITVKSGGITFIPGADDKNPVVGAASVIAKDARDKSPDKSTRKSWKNAGKGS